VLRMLKGRLKTMTSYVCIQTEEVIDVARGYSPADLLLKNPFVVNVFSGEVVQTSVAVKNGVIAGLGDYTLGREVVDLQGKYLIPGLIDGHIHIESSMLTPAGFAAAAVPHGTTTAIADPHEIVNVAGLKGFRYMVESSRGLPMDILYMVPSCVPATRMETSGAVIGPGEALEAFEIYPESPGLAEMMNFPGVCLKLHDILRKLKAAAASGRVVDGHAPMLSGMDLNAYISAGIKTDHECTTPDEAREKLRLGMKIIIREGSAAKNLKALVTAVNERTYPNFFFGCDDRHPGDLIVEGGIDHILRRAVKEGLDPVTAVRMATINPALHYNLRGIGGIAPGFRADLVVVEDLTNFQVRLVYKSGKLAACDGIITCELPASAREEVLNTVHLPELKGRLKLKVPAVASKVRVIEVFPDQILTRCNVLKVDEIESMSGIARVAVVERHGKNGNVALGLVTGFGPIKGTLVSTVAHDSHNLIIVGANEHDMELAAQTAASMGGGLAVISNGEVLASMALPVAGLMSFEDAETVARQHEKLNHAAIKIGCTLPAPFMTMSFLSLPVIPELRITDMGLVDAQEFKLFDLWMSD